MLTIDHDTLELSAYARPQHATEPTPDLLTPDMPTPDLPPTAAAMAAMPGALPRWDATADAFRRQWIPVLGPAAGTLYLALVDLAHDLTPGQVRAVSVLALGGAIGVGERKAARTVAFALGRLERYGLVTCAYPYVAVQPVAPPPPHWAVRRVPLAWRREIGVAC